MEQVAENSTMQSRELAQKGAKSVPAHMTHSSTTRTNRDQEVGIRNNITNQRRIVTSPYDFTVGSIIELIDNGGITLPNFQRNYFWNDIKASRLVESVILNVPIPSCFLAENEDYSNDIIDGQQRLFSLYRFVKGEFALKNLEVLSDYNNHIFSELPIRIQRKIQSHIIRCVVINMESDTEVKFDVFERLNSDTTPLNAQEIRNCIFMGNSMTYWVNCQMKRNGFQFGISMNLTSEC